MIIYDDDAVSVHTLVASPNENPISESTNNDHPSGNHHHIPTLLPLFCFHLLSTSITPVFFALINIPLSPLYTLPTIIAFTTTIPFHFGATHFFLHLLKRNTTAPIRWPWKWLSKKTVLIYTLFLQMAWVASIVTSTIVLTPRSKPRLEGFCSQYGRDYSSADAAVAWVGGHCVGIMMSAFKVTVVFSCLVVISLVFISLVVFGWDVQPYAASEPSAGPQSMQILHKHRINTHFLLPLTHCSLGLLIPTFIIAIDPQTGHPATSLLISNYFTPAIVGFSFTSYFHLLALAAWYKEYWKAHRVQISSTSNSTVSILLPSPPVWFATVYLAFLPIPWIVSTILPADMFLTKRPWASAAYLSIFNCSSPLSESHKCPKLYLATVTVATSIQALVLIVMFWLSLKYLIHERRNNALGSMLGLENGDSSPGSTAADSPLSSRK